MKRRKITTLKRCFSWPVRNKIIQEEKARQQNQKPMRDIVYDVCVQSVVMTFTDFSITNWLCFGV